MEIPYITTPRKDTGLVNSKIAIWLFLASEVMLFGGFFSAYVYLRVGADYPWPERALPVLPGLINTFILIASSVTVVFAWAALKMRQWRKFQVFMGITVACAAIFMVLKGVEYYVKLHHQAIRFDDYAIVEGHLGYEKDKGEEDGYLKDHNGDKIEENKIRIKAEALTFAVKRFHASWVEEIIAEAKHQGSKITLADDVKLKVEGSEEGADAERVLVAKKGEELSVDLLKRFRGFQMDAQKNNSAVRTEALRDAWVVAKKENPGKADWEYSTDVNIDTKALEHRFLDEAPAIKFVLSKPTELLFKPRDVQEADGQSRLRDDTVVIGKLEASPMIFHYVDALDFEYLVMKAEEKGVDPEVAIENSWLMKNNQWVRDAWAWHQGEMEKLRADLIEKWGTDEETGLPNRSPNHKDLYRMGWKDFAKMGEEKKNIEIGGIDSFKENIFGPNYDVRKNETFPELSIPREEIRFAAKFSPAWNTYYAIYFTITGIHGLHVIGGALVLAYYLFFGRKMYLENPEWLANRVEVGGLFWHFVDLVWIFAFPILYLM